MSRPRSILLAEDNSVNQRVAAHLLAFLGHHCDIASNGSEVLEAMSRKSYDLILMDIRMPVMDGLETARRIRASLRTPPRIVALTGSDCAEDRAACLAAGMSGFVSKPVSLEALRQVIELEP